MLDARGTAAPLFLHWGADLGELSQQELVELADTQIPAIPPSSIDAPGMSSILPLPSQGWTGTPSLVAVRGGLPVELSLVLAEPPVVGDGTVSFELHDDRAALSVSVTLSLTAEGVLEISQQVANSGHTTLLLVAADLAAPVPPRASEVLHFSGRWSHERRPQRSPLHHGVLTTASRHGRNGHDGPLFFAVGTPDFGFRRGEVWSVHLAWSGDQHLRSESHPTGHTILAGGELLTPGEISLGPGESYQSPVLLGAWSDAGLDGVTRRFHSRTRRSPGWTDRPRPLIVNTWEAVYFEHDLDALSQLARDAASIGAERFVLDDGWMPGRTDDTRALGDWTVDGERWPEGLHSIVNLVNELGMDFGLWVEPEMVSVDSELARAHPDWILATTDGRLPLPWRNQFAVDLANPDAYEYVRNQLIALLVEYPIAYLKWDQNRDLLTASSHGQVTATWRLMSELRERFPELQIESCSSGGARVDLGVLERADRVWASDTNDPLERQAIQRWTSVIVPPEAIGSHLGAERAHTTGRRTDLSLRLATALFGWAGIEWDLTEANAEDRAAITTWTALYKRLRPLIHHGTTVRSDPADPALTVHGVVSDDGAHGLFAAVCLAAPRDAVSTGLTLPGLTDDDNYRVEVVDVGAPVRFTHNQPPPWWAQRSTVQSGRVLSRLGLAWPALAPEQAIIIEVTKV